MNETRTESWEVLICTEWEKKEWLVIEGEGETAFRDLGEPGEGGALRKEEGETFRKEKTHSIHCCKKWRSREAVKTAGYIGMNWASPIAHAGDGTQGPDIHAHLVIFPVSSWCLLQSQEYWGVSDGEGVPLCLLPLASGGDYRACSGVTIWGLRWLFLGQGQDRDIAAHLCEDHFLTSQREGGQSCELVSIPSFKGWWSNSRDGFLWMWDRGEWGQRIFKTCPVGFPRFLFYNFYFPVCCFL